MPFEVESTQDNAAAFVAGVFLAEVVMLYIVFDWMIAATLFAVVSAAGLAVSKALQHYTKIPVAHSVVPHYVNIQSVGNTEAPASGTKPPTGGTCAA